MKKAMGLVEILFVLIIIILCVIFFNPKSGRKNPFEEIKEVKSQQQVIDTKIQEIEDVKAMQQKIYENLNNEGE